jgi:TonB family protein
MTKSKHTRNLFNASGCLTLDAINRYHSGRLSNKDLEIVRQHMEECELCRDAVEGYKHFTNQKRQLELINSLRKKIRSRYSIRPARVLSGRDRRLNPTLTYISAAATILIILGIYGLVNTGIFRHENYVAGQIKEEEVKSEDQLTQAEKPVSEAQREVPPERSQQPDTFKYLADDQEPELPEETAVIIRANEMAEKAIPEMDVHLERTVEAMIPNEPMDTVVIEGVRNVAGVEVETVSVAGASAARKAAALPVKAVSVEMDVETKKAIEDTGGIETNTLFFTWVDEMPQFSVNGYQDFNDYIRKNLKYPENAKERGVTGKILIQFIVNKYGKVIDVKAIQVVDPLLDQEAIRVVKSSPRWKPGTKNGEKANVQLVYPVIFE